MSKKKTAKTQSKTVETVEKKEKKALWMLPAILVLAATIRLLYLKFSQDSPFYQPLLLDPAYYHRWALEILRGRFSEGPVFYGLPLYPFFIAFVYKLSANSVFVLKVVQIVLGLMTIGLIYKTGQEIADRRTGLMAAFFAALYGPMFFHEQVLIPEALGMPIYALAFYSACLFENHPTIKQAVLLGSAFGLAALTKAGIVLFVFLFLLLLWWRAWRRRQDKRAIAVCLLIFFLTISPVGLYNWFHGKDFVPLSSHAGVNFYIGNNPKAEGVFVEPEGTGGNVESQIQDSQAVAEKQLQRALKPSEVSRYWSDKACEFIRDNPAEFLKLCAAKLALFFDAREISDVDDYAFSKKYNPMLNWPWPDFAILGPLVFLGLACAFGKIRHVQLMALWIGGYAGGLMMFFVNARYRLPMLSIFFLLAAFGLRELGQRIRKRHWPMVLLYCFVLAVGIRIGQLNLVGTAWSRDWVNAGDAYLKMNNYDEALRHYQKALTVEPDSFSANNAMGMILMRTNDYRRAKPYFEKAIQINPQKASAYTNLGMCYNAEKDTKSARRLFEKAIELKPNSSEAHNNLGMIYGNQGEYEKALAEFEAALRINPSSPRALTNVGLVYYRLGQKEKALDYWRRALSIDPQFPDARRAMQMIETSLGI